MLLGFHWWWWWWCAFPELAAFPLLRYRYLFCEMETLAPSGYWKPVRRLGLAPCCAGWALLCSDNDSKFTAAHPELWTPRQLSRELVPPVWIWNDFSLLLCSRGFSESELLVSQMCCSWRNRTQRVHVAPQLLWSSPRFIGVGYWMSRLCEGLPEAALKDLHWTWCQGTVWPWGEVKRGPRLWRAVVNL